MVNNKRVPKSKVAFMDGPSAHRLLTGMPFSKRPAHFLAALASLVTGGELMLACGGKVVFEDGNGGAGGASSTVHGSVVTGNATSGKSTSGKSTSGKVTAANVTTGSVTSGASACQMAADAIIAKATQCGLSVGTGGGGGEPCSSQQGAQAQAIADCYVNASCDAITGADVVGAQNLAQCLQNTAG